nr:hypothetical protein [Tanacetum cinerariifolium]
MTLTERRVVQLEHPSRKDDDVLAETIPLDASEVVEKTKKRGKLPVMLVLIPAGSSVSSEVAEPHDDRPTDSVFGLNLRTRHPSMRYVVSLDDSHHSSLHSEINYFARSLVADAPVMTGAVTTTIATDVSNVPVSKDGVKSRNLESFEDSASAGGANTNVTDSFKLTTSLDSFYASQDLDSETMHIIYVPKWKVTNDSVLDDPYVFRDLTDRLAPPVLSKLL